MNTVSFRDLQIFDKELHVLNNLISATRVMAETMSERIAGHKCLYPSMDDAKIKSIFRDELNEQESKVSAAYDSMLSCAVTCGFDFPYSIDEILNYIENSIK